MDAISAQLFAKTKKEWEQGIEEDEQDKSIVGLSQGGEHRFGTSLSFICHQRRFLRR